ncbi:endonuclease/exonuclease/phosphatase family protein [Nonomuraea sp. NBC_01738]|uniref:endonuclease/exonuclease/phosphatase family protein n=1 Tax=Nonomuraea sp. NBC_01738 TaxID=2976003 RepID=UPI002E12B274|nr:endonuclease/exonuclease/phosphatase family protein [Nonomuraea sp. NBC_01738]
MRVLEWNIWLGGRDPENLAMTTELIASLDPDVFLSIETYGAAERILAALPGHTGVRVTSGPRDNLWIFTRLPITHVYGKPHGTLVDDFRFGGLRAELPEGGEASFFVTWLSFTEPWLGDLVADKAPWEQVLAAEERQHAEITDILEHQLPALLGEHDGPVILGGDFNALSTSDWPGLRTTEVMTGAGYTDTFRAMSGDPGHTWSTQPDRAHIPIPERIDYVFAKGLAPKASFTVSERLPGHPEGPFYSDHAALVTDF